MNKRTRNIWRVKYGSVGETKPGSVKPDEGPGTLKLVEANTLKEALAAAADVAPEGVSYLRGHAHITYVGPFYDEYRPYGDLTERP